MRYPLLLITIILTTACKREQQKQPNTPLAFQDKSVDVSTYSKRIGMDMVDELYDELESNDPALKRIGREISEAEALYADSLQSFRRYDANSTGYYAAAMSHLAMVKDTTIKKQITRLIADHKQQYSQTKLVHDQIIKALDREKMRMADLYTLLKISRTLKMMNNYQEKNITDTTVLSSVLATYEKLNDKITEEWQQADTTVVRQ